ncbi:ABC transporter permease [Lichenifustis flavocetrariae]|uniref:ABC transporter permease n=1 Tax=Lichenifustis flavocetrariae TaxID=2949735 RepID=A0AA41YSF6_9HYPH|nr:ABC transporter permease [Lichenifustis flavocetrariae]MCW6507329.1 ABC transporter permease [Lichenifustis flavocetrariae]
MPRNRAAPFILGAGGLAAFLAVWQVAPSVGLVSSTLLPKPSDIPAAFAAEVRNGLWLEAVGLSLGHYLLGLLCGGTAGVALGIASGMSVRFELSLAWIVRVLRPIPGLAWVPFAILWFGVEQSAAVFIIAIGVFWIVFFASQGAIRGVDRELIEVADAFGFTGAFAKLRKVMLPAALPGILVGLRTALGQAWMSVVAAELFGVAGLGQRMTQASSLLATDIVVVYMLTIAALYGAMDTLFVFVQGRLLAYRP